jgi:hypothetical protein
MPARVDPAHVEEVRSARSLSQMGLERVVPGDHASLADSQPEDLCEHASYAAAREDWTGWGTEGFLGRRKPPGVKGKAHHNAEPEALILMGDWCAAAQPIFENQVRGESGDGECSLEGRSGALLRCRGVCLPLDGGG